MSGRCVVNAGPAAVLVLFGVGAASWALAAPATHGASAGRSSRPRHVSSPSTGPSRDAFDAAESAGIARRWGIRIESLRVTASGHMLDLRYTVVDAQKAKPLFERRTKPVLRDEASGVELPVPVPPKTGALRNSNTPQAGRTYFMFFGNPGRLVAAGRRVTVTIGAFSVTGLRVDADSAGAGGVS
jgi:hypothetical protein